MPQGNFDVIFRAVTDTSGAKAEFSKLLNEFAGSEAEFRTKVVGDQKSLNDFIENINNLAKKNKVELNFDHSALKSAQDMVVDLQTKINNIDFKNVEKQFKKMSTEDLFKIDNSFIKEGIKNARKEFDKLYRTELNKKNLTLNTSAWGSYDKKTGETLSVDEKRFGKQIAEWDRYYKRLQDRVTSIRSDINSGAINKYSAEQLNDVYKKILEIQALQSKVEEWNPWMKDGDSGKKRRYDLSGLMMEPGKFKNVSAELLNSLSPISEKLGIELKSSLEEAEAAIKSGTDSLLSSLNFVFQKIGPISVEVVPEVDAKKAKKKIEDDLNGENIEVKVKVKSEPIEEDGLSEDYKKQYEEAEKYVNTARKNLEKLIEFNKSGDSVNKRQIITGQRWLSNFASATEMPSEEEFLNVIKNQTKAKPYFGIFEDEKPAEVKVEPKVVPGSVQEEVEKDSKKNKAEVKVSPIVENKGKTDSSIDGKSIELIPDTSEFKRKSDEELAKIVVDKEVELVPNVENFKQKADDKLLDIKLDKGVELTPIIDNFKTAADEKLSGIDLSANINLTPKLDDSLLDVLKDGDLTSLTRKEADRLNNAVYELNAIRTKLTVFEDFSSNPLDLAAYMPTENDIRSADVKIKELFGTNNIFNVDELIKNRNEWFKEFDYALDRYNKYLKENDESGAERYKRHFDDQLGAYNNYIPFLDQSWNRDTIANKIEKITNDLNKNIDSLFVSEGGINIPVNLDANFDSLSNAIRTIKNEFEHIDSETNWDFSNLKSSLLNVVDQFKTSLSAVGINSKPLNDAYEMIKGWNDADRGMLNAGNAIRERGAFINSKTGARSNPYFYDQEGSVDFKIFDEIQKLAVGIDGKLDSLYDTRVHSHPLKDEKHNRPIYGANVAFSSGDIEVAVNDIIYRGISKALVTSGNKYSMLDLTDLDPAKGASFLRTFKKNLSSRGFSRQSDGSYAYHINEFLNTINNKEYFDYDKMTATVNESLAKALESVGLDSSRIKTGNISDLNLDLSSLNGTTENVTNNFEQLLLLLRQISIALEDINRNGFKFDALSTQGKDVELNPDSSEFKQRSDSELEKIHLDKNVLLVPDATDFKVNADILLDKISVDKKIDLTPVSLTGDSKNLGEITFTTNIESLTGKIVEDLTALQNRIKSSGLNTINLTAKTDKNYAKYLSKFDDINSISSSMSDSLIDEFNITDKNAKSQIKSLVESLRTIKTQEIVTGQESIEFMRTFEALGNVISSNAQEFSMATDVYESFYEAFKRAGSIKISDSIISDLGEEWNELRKTYPNKFTVNSGIEIDSVYGQWQEQYQGILPDVSDPTERFKALINAIREARKEMDTLYKVNPDEDFMENMYASITERMYNMQNALSNFVSNPQLENEIAQFNRLGDSIKTVEAAIESKNKAIIQEANLVSSKIPEETGEFAGLKSVIDNIDFNKAFADVNIDAGKLNIGVEPRVNVTEFEALAQAQLGDASVSIGLSPTINPTEFTTLVESQLGKVKPTLTIPAANIDFSGVQNESSNLDEVAQKLKLIIDRIREKNELFKLEGKIVGKTVPNETKRLGQMASVLRDIERSLKTISFVLQTTDFSKVKLSNSQSSKKKSGSSSNNSNSNVQKVVGAYKGLISTEEQYQKLQYDVQQNRLGENVNKKKKQLEDLRIKREKYNNTIEETLKLEKDLDKNAAIVDQKSKYDSKVSEVEVAMGQYRKPNSYIASVEKFISNASKGELSGSQSQALDKLKQKLVEIKKYTTDGILNSDADIDEINNLQKEIEDLYRHVTNKKLAPVGEKEIARLRSEITSFANTNTAAKEYIPVLDEILRRLDSKNLDRTIFDKASTDFYELKAAINSSGKSGLSMLDKWKKRLESVGLYFASFASIYDVINKLRQGFEIIVQYDDSLTEMKKVSDETMVTLKDFQQASFNLGNTVGTTGSQIQASTADFMRLGESLEDAAQSALDANTLFKVSEFGTIEEATEALISMSQAYQELEKSEINDIMNYVGNNFAISTEGLATGLQKSAAALKTAGNDIYEAVSLITAGNTIIQDADQVGAGIRTISLRILGTETAKEELASLGEDVEDFVVQTQSKIDKTVREYTAVASNNYRGVSLLDSNGNYRSTYEILQDIADVYQEILEADKKAGTNRGSALVELLAGKNRSNIAASILQNPQILRDVYEQAQTESAGSAQKELEAQLESISSHLAKLKNQWESIWITDYNRESINFVLDRLTDILSIVEAIGAVPVFGLAGGGFAFFKNFD